jgi:hypothetical protein
MSLAEVDCTIKTTYRSKEDKHHPRLSNKNKKLLSQTLKQSSYTLKKSGPSQFEIELDVNLREIYLAIFNNAGEELFFASERFTAELDLNQVFNKLILTIPTCNHLEVL